MRVGAIVQDRAGEMLVTLSASQNYIIEPIVAEASAALRATIFY
jgi:hypothetical protein